MSKQASLVVLISIILIGVALRSYQLTARSLWFDEAFSWRLVQFPVTEMITRDAADVHPPLYYLALQGWSVVFGTSLLALRSFSVAAAAATVAGAYLFSASAARSRSAGLLAAAGIALSGWQIQFGWEARMYTLGTALAFLSSWALLRAIRSEPQRFLPWLFYAVAATAFIYTHYYALFTVAAHILFVLSYLLVTTRGRVGELLQARRLWYALGSAVVSLLLFLPWLPTFLQQNNQVQQAFWIGPMNRWSLPDALYRMWVPTAGYIAHDTWLQTLAVFLPLVGTVFLLIILACHLPRKRSFSEADWLVIMLVVVPFLLSILLSIVGQSLFQDRFFVFAHIFLLAAFALVVSRMPWQWVRGGLIIAMVLGFTVGYVRYWHEIDVTHKPGVHAAAEYIYQDADSSSSVLVSSPFVYFAVLHYATEEFAAPTPPRLYSSTGELAHFAGGPILIPSDVVDASIFTTPTSPLWVVDTTGFGGTPLEVPAPWRAIETKTYPEVFPHQGDVSVTKYER